MNSGDTTHHSPARQSRRLATLAIACRAPTAAPNWLLQLQPTSNKAKSIYRRPPLFNVSPMFLLSPVSCPFQRAFWNGKSETIDLIPMFRYLLLCMKSYQTTSMLLFKLFISLTKELIVIQTIPSDATRVVSYLSSVWV